MPKKPQQDYAKAVLDSQTPPPVDYEGQKSYYMEMGKDEDFIKGKC